jgi:hypothetical protein
MLDVFLLRPTALELLTDCLPDRSILIRSTIESGEK